MILETKRAIADWLGHATYGIAAVLATLSYDGTDVAPVGTWQIADDTRGTAASDNAAIHRFEAESATAFPAIHVTADDVSSADGQAATYTHDGDVPVTLLVAVRSASPSAAIRDLDYAMRALLIVLETLFDPAIPAAVTASVRNGVQLKYIQSLNSLRFLEQLEHNVATAQMRAVIACRDTLA